MFKFKYNSEHLKFLQDTNQNVEVYSKLSAFEHEQVKAFIPVQPKVIMDLGCGLGRASVYLKHILNPVDIKNDIHFILADTADLETMNMIASFCTLNGLLNFGLFNTEKSDWKGLSNIDYMMSRNDYGIYNPVPPIMDKLLNISTPDVTMIFGTNNRSVYSLNSFRDLFKEVYFLEEDKQEPFPQQDWLILRGKK